MLLWCLASRLDHVCSLVWSTRKTAGKTLFRMKIGTPSSIWKQYVNAWTSTVLLHAFAVNKNYEKLLNLKHLDSWMPYLNSFLRHSCKKCFNGIKKTNVFLISHSINCSRSIQHIFRLFSAAGQRTQLQHMSKPWLHFRLFKIPIHLLFFIETIRNTSIKFSFSEPF